MLEGPRIAGSRPAKVRLVGASHAIETTKIVAAAVARRLCTVVILGETGTGKEVLARYVHDQSSRCDCPFVPVDCSALSDTLFESELFGHIRGAYAGAVRDSLGFIRSADSGTLFLDEIGELSLPLQAKLLRVIQERQVVPVGDTRARPVDVRIIAATHRDLASMVRQGSFRQDLYFRLNVVVLTLPPLRQRREDIIELAEHFLESQARMYDEAVRHLSGSAKQSLLDYDWPGNVRELANAMEQAHVLAHGQAIETTDLPQRIQRDDADLPLMSDLCLKDLERRAISEALSRTHNNKAAACRLLGINIQKLNRRLIALNLRPRG